MIRFKSRWQGGLLVCGALLMSACQAAGTDSGEEIELARVESDGADTGDLPERELALARETASRLAQDLSQLVFSTMENEGAVATVRVCSEVAQQRTADHARDGIYVRRISDRLRNPLNAPDATEARELERMRVLDAQESLPTEIIRFVEQGESRSLHLLRPIRIQQPCLACHGATESMDPEVRQLLSERYPDDRATGYRAGQLRGAVSVRVPVQSAP
jgi:hypothetical protein